MARSPSGADPALQKINEGVQLPDKAITVIHREDKSGTTFLFTQYLAGASEAWKKKIGPASSGVKWPVGKGIERNYGVAGEVKRTDGSIGYVETLHALNNKIATGAIQNADKTAFLQAKPEYVTAAARTLDKADLETGAFSLTNRQGKDAYPICGVEWAVCAIRISPRPIRRRSPISCELGHPRRPKVLPRICITPRCPKSWCNMANSNSKRSRPAPSELAHLG